MMGISMGAKTTLIRAALARNVYKLKWNACILDGQTDRWMDSFSALYRYPHLL